MKLAKKTSLLLVLVVCVLVTAAGGFFLLWGGKSQEEQREAAVQAAESWIRNSSPTFAFDGTGLELQAVERNAREGEAPAAYMMVFEFESRHAGYGDRSGEMLAQVITPHELEVRVEKDPKSGRWKVVRAVTDGVFDELTGEFLKDAKHSQTRRVDVYFMQVVDGQEEPVAVSRDVDAPEGTGATGPTTSSGGAEGEPGMPSVEVAALEALLDGPQPDETEQELYSSIPEGVEIERFELRDRTAYVSFSAELDQGVAGSARVQAIREQIQLTLKQFEHVDRVEIAVEGQSEGILQP